MFPTGSAKDAPAQDCVAIDELLLPMLRATDHAESSGTVHSVPARACGNAPCFVCLCVCVCVCVFVSVYSSSSNSSSNSRSISNSSSSSSRTVCRCYQ